MATLTDLTKAAIQRNVLLVLLLLVVGFMATGCGGNSNGNNNGVDTTPPNLSNGAPSGVLAAGTNSALLSITSDEDATCRYANTRGVDYLVMTHTFSSTGGTSHSTTLGGLQDGQSYNYYVRCQDASANRNTTDYAIVFYISDSGVSPRATCSEIDHPDCLEITSCGVLDQADTYYLLMNDVSSEETCFWVSAENIILNLNQYTVDYDQLDIPAVPNGDFETDDMSGWDLSGASGWQLVSELKAINNRTLHLPNPGGSVVLSPPFQIPRAEYKFVASVFYNGLEATMHTASIDFIRTDTGTTIPCGTGLPEVRYNSGAKDNDKELGGIVCDISTTDTPEVRVRITTTGPMLIDHVDFRGFLHPAIVASNGYNPNHQYYSDRPGSVQDVLGKLEVRNGTIFQGNARSGKGIVGYGISHIVLNQVSLIMQDTPNNKGVEHIGAGSEQGMTNLITNNTIEVPTVGVFKRDWIGAALSLHGPSIVVGNTIRTDTAGIYVNPKNGAAYVEGIIVSNNNVEMGFRHASMARNHYGIWTAAFMRPVISNNTLTGQGQGGINLVHAYEGEVFDNVVDMQPRCGLRFGARGTTDRLNVAGIVIRDNPKIVEQADRYSIRNKIYDNEVTMTVDPALMEPDCRVKAMAFWERNRYEFDQTRGGDNEIFNNTFTAINLEDEPNVFGTSSIVAAMSFQSRSPTQKERVYSNTLQSNNILLIAGMAETYDRGVLIHNNTMRKLNTGVVPAAYRMRPFENIFNWDAGGVVIRDNIWENGADKYDYWQDGHTGSLKAENTLTINVLNASSNPVSGAAVTIVDTDGTVAATGVTDADGSFVVVVTDFEVFGYLNNKYYNPYTVAATYNATSDSVVVNVDSEENVTLTLN